MSIIKHTYPILYRKTATGSVQQWEIWVEERKNNNNSVWIMIKYGKKDSPNIRTIESQIKSGKRKNTIAETTPLQQAQLEAKSKWDTKKSKQGYTESTNFNINKVVVLPMLASKFDPSKVVNKSKDKQKRSRGINIILPAFVQPKIDGIRGLTHFDSKSNPVVLSRRNTPYPSEIIQHILNDLKKVYKQNISKNMNRPKLYLDGEFYTDELPFEELNGLLHSKKIENVDLSKVKLIKYYIFDCFDLDDMEMPFSERTKLLSKLITPKYKTLVNVDTYKVNTLKQVDDYMTQFISDGYEGLMIRNSHSPYELKKRSKHLQKYKKFIEEEFEIVGFKEGRGEDVGTVIWIVKTEDGNEFSVRPTGTREHRQQLFETGDEYIGKLLTVKFFEYSKKKVPRFPVGKSIRHDIN